eukprot:TRINITY_DN5234_c0_g1_i2.p3 TRINITY_DN5234_c0_g1~~TRINITY_DN5234_c0_g1_i2.p3  ORF type:complete len:189 (-),score=62.24 TRINITY_DN5234_c0_g1_i2:19-585(-)
MLAIVDAAVDKTTITHMGWPNFGAGDLPLEMAAYADWEIIRDLGQNDDVGLGRAFVRYERPVDEILVMYALSQKSTYPALYSTIAYMGGIIFPPSCQCSASAPETRVIAVPTLPVGQCTMTTRTFTPHVCDLLGTKWCRTIDVLAWRATGPEAGGTVPCASSPLTVQRYQSEYAPSPTFAQPTGQAPE